MPILSRHPETAFRLHASATTSTASHPASPVAHSFGESCVKLSGGTKARKDPHSSGSIYFLLGCLRTCRFAGKDAHQRHKCNRRARAYIDCVRPRLTGVASCEEAMCGCEHKHEKA